MSIFVIQRDFPVALVIEARREFDRLRTAISLARASTASEPGPQECPGLRGGPQHAIDLIAGLYLAGPGRSLSIVRAADKSVVLELLTSGGLRHSSIHRATAFPHQTGASN